MAHNPSPGPSAMPHIQGAVPLGVTRKVTRDIVREVSRQLRQSGRFVTVKAMHCLPSSRTAVEDGSFQFVANTFIEVPHGDNAPPRPDALDSVVTVGHAGGAQKLESVTIPALRRVSA